jgi:hypothetical protein
VEVSLLLYVNSVVHHDGPVYARILIFADKDSAQRVNLAFDCARQRTQVLQEEEMHGALPSAVDRRLAGLPRIRHA